MQPLLFFLPVWQVQSGAKASKDLDFGLWPQTLDHVSYPPDHSQSSRVLLGRRDHELEKVLNLLVEAEK
jgi:hypothetical protein